MPAATDNIIAVLSTTPERWERLVRSLPLEALARQPQPGEWSAIECLQHLIAIEEFVFPPRVHALLEGRAFQAFDPVAYHANESIPDDPLALTGHFTQLRFQTLELLGSLKPEDLSHSAEHSQLGTVTLGELLNEWAAHDLNHTIQAERALMQPFIVACGPWRSYFADHDIDPRINANRNE